MSVWNNKTIPFWQDIKYFPNKFIIIGFLNNDPRLNWPESFQPSIYEIIEKLSLAKTSYIKIKEEGEVYFVNILAEKIIVSCTLFKDKNELILNKKNGFQYATNYFKTRFIKDGIKIEHDGIEIFDGKRDFYNQYNETHKENLKNGIENLLLYIKTNSSIKIMNRDSNEEENEDEFNESEASKIEEILETLEAYVNKEYEIEDTKARAEKPFVYTNFKAEDIASTYKYYYRITLLKEDVKRLREFEPRILQIKKIDDTFMDLEIFDIKPKNSPNDIVVTTSFQTDRNIIDNSNELYLAAIPTLKKVRLKVIDDLRSKISPNKWLIPLASGVYSFDKTIPVPVPKFDFEEFPRLRAQDEAIAKGVGSKDITLTLGPPGTGKTTIIVAWAKYYASQGKKILITSQNNKAVDNVLERLAKEKDLECLRVGNESNVSSSIHDLLIENYSLSAQKKLIDNIDLNILKLSKYLVYLTEMKEFMNKKNFIENEHKKINSVLDMINDLKKCYARSDEYTNGNLLKKILFFFQNKINQKRVKTLEQDLNINNISIYKFYEEIEHKKEILVNNLIQIPDYQSSDLVNNNFYKAIYEINGQYDEKFILQIENDFILIKNIFDVIEKFKFKMLRERQSTLYETILEYVDVVGATCIGINSNRLFADIPFDVVIVDESGQIQLHNLMVPLSRASKAILVGDHKQLPPVVDDELAAELEEQGFDPIFLQKSWFEILWDPMPEDHKTMLDTQFRCPAIISDFVSKAFYESKYFAGSGMEQKQAILPYFNSTMTFIDTSKVFPSFEQSRITDGRTEVLGNEVETTIIIKTLMNFIKELPYLAEKNEIGIIVPYKNHVLEVKRTIKKLKLDIGNLNVEDLVASVDSYQGQERDVIIFAFSRSNKGGNIGFLADWRRLNVAMTRTKKQLIMVGSLKTLTKDNQKEHEVEFKQAMRILESELRAKDSIIDGRKFVNGVKK
jgi:superfamily I DNA and/or RNA helicase